MVFSRFMNQNWIERGQFYINRQLEYIHPSPTFILILHSSFSYIHPSPTFILLLHSSFSYILPSPTFILLLHSSFSFIHPSPTFILLLHSSFSNHVLQQKRDELFCNKINQYKDKLRLYDYKRAINPTRSFVYAYNSWSPGKLFYLTCTHLNLNKLGFDLDQGDGAKTSS